MKKILTAVFSLVFVILAVPGLVSAQAESPSSETSNQAPEATLMTENEANSAEAEKQEDRIKQYKEKLKTRITASESRRIAGACKAAQVITSQVNDSLSTIRENRTQKYSTVTERLTNISVKIKNAGLDTTTLDSNITQLQTLTDEFKQSMDEYQTLLNDLSTMDCASDPEAFKSALELTKEQRESLRTQSQEIKSYIIETIKPELQNLRQQLNQTADSGEGTE